MAAPHAAAAPADDGLRADGRASTVIRPAECARGLLPRTDGSARWTAGATSVLAGVHGPRSTLARCEHPTAAVVSAEWGGGSAPASAAPDADGGAAALTAAVAGAVRGAVLAGAAPRTAVTVALHTLSADGGLLAAAINAASAALVDAGVPMRHTLAAAAVAVGGGEEEADAARLSVDPTAAEEAAAPCVATFAFAARATEPGGPPVLADGGAVAVHVRGRVGDDALVAAEALARGAAGAAARLAREGLGRCLGVE